MTLSFGTDGVRGLANSDLTPEFAVALGRVAGTVLSEAAGPAEAGRRPVFLVGEDTRASSSMLAAALSAGLMSAGCDVTQLGVIPTAGVALLTQDREAAGGAVVSASHNPAHDNGIKFFGPGGQKLGDDVEAEVERRLAGHDEKRAAPTATGRDSRDETAAQRYADLLLATVKTRLDGLRIVVDTANGAASTIGPEVLRRAGADLVVLNDTPDGANINAGCGATAPAGLAAAVLEHRAHAGVAFDGDADRLIAVDEAGEVVDGDHILAICGLDLHERGALVGETVVATIMSNMGLRQALRGHGIGLVATPVGDRNVLVELERNGFVLGGEQSGHIIFRDLAPTGCGLLSALQLLQVLNRTGRPLSELAAVMPVLPQRLVNVTLADRTVLDRADDMWAVVEAVRAELGDEGHVVVRASGTEPKLRIMVQAGDEALVSNAVERIVRSAESLT